MQSPKQATQFTKRDYQNHLNLRTGGSKRPFLSPKNENYHHRNLASASPRKKKLTPRKDRLTKTPSKLFQKARSTDFGQTYLVGQSTMFQRFTSTNASPSQKAKNRMGQLEPREVILGLEHAYNIRVNGAPSLSEIINQFDGDSKINLSKIQQISDDMLEIHSNFEPSQLAKQTPRK